MKIVAAADDGRRQADGFVVAKVSVPDLGIDRDVDLSFGRLRELCGETDALALDFLLAASVCYVVDKSVPRKSADDDWTRELEVEIPVSDPDRWNAVSSELASTLSFLTGDAWQLEFTPLAVPHWVRPRRKPKVIEFKSDAVCLFSGGLDSLVGAINLLASESEKKILLLGHYDTGAAAQEYLYQRIKERYPARTNLLRVRVGHKPAQARENTLRSRSMVFLALGFYAAKFYGESVPLYACENGAIAMNVPLTVSRWGSCSTRTMHPYFLTSLQNVLRRVGIENPLVTPLEFLAKGECMQECQDQDLLKDIAHLSVSCSHPTRRQDWVRKGANGCGYCFPCLFRRASLHKIGIDQGQLYGIDVCKGELSATDSRRSSNDLRAAIDFLRNAPNVENIAEEIAFAAPVSDLQVRAEMIGRAFEEIRSLFRDKGVPEIKRLSGST